MLCNHHSCHTKRVHPSAAFWKHLRMFGCRSSDQPPISPMNSITLDESMKVEVLDHCEALEVLSAILYISCIGQRSTNMPRFPIFASAQLHLPPSPPFARLAATLTQSVSHTHRRQTTANHNLRASPVFGTLYHLRKIQTGSSHESPVKAAESCDHQGSSVCVRPPFHGRALGPIRTAPPDCLALLT